MGSIGIQRDYEESGISWNYMQTLATKNLINKWITEDVYVHLVDDMEQIIMNDLSHRTPIYCGNILDIPGCMISFPFEILYLDKDFDTVHNKRFIARVLPPHKKENGKILHNILKKDGHVSQNILQFMNSALDLNREDSVVFPKLSFIRLHKPGMELLVHEDFCFNRGYRLNDYSHAMPCTYAFRVMETYARFHAASILVKAERGMFEKLCEDLTLDFVTNEHLLKAKKHMIEANALLLDRVDGFKDTSIWLRKLKIDVLENFLKSFKPNEKFEVLTLGSITENLLYFSSDDYEVCLSSFGGAKINSLATDINNFIFTCLDSHTRRNELSSLLKHYYAVFSSILNMGFEEVPFTFKELEIEVYKTSLVGILSAIQNFPSYFGERRFTPDLYYFNINDLDKYNTDYSKTLNTLYNCNTNFRNIIFDFYSDIVSYSLHFE